MAELVLTKKEGVPPRLFEKKRKCAHRQVLEHAPFDVLVKLKNGGTSCPVSVPVNTNMLRKPDRVETKPDRYGCCALDPAPSRRLRQKTQHPTSAAKFKEPNTIEK